MSFLLSDFEDFKAKIKAKEEREIASIKERVMVAIQPKYAEIDQIRAEELATLQNNYTTKRDAATEQYNAQLVALQENFESKKKEIIDLAEKRKKDLLETVLQNETYEIAKDCERAIADIDNLIAKTKKE